MKIYLNPWPLPALQRARRLFVSSARRCSHNCALNSRWLSHGDPPPSNPARNLADQAYLSIFVDTSYPSSPIQST